MTAPHLPPLVFNFLECSMLMVGIIPSGHRDMEKEHNERQKHATVVVSPSQRGGLDV